LKIQVKTIFEENYIQKLILNNDEIIAQLRLNNKVIFNEQKSTI